MTILEELEANYMTQAFQVPNYTQAEDEAFKLGMEKLRAAEYELIVKFAPQWKIKADEKAMQEKTASLLKIGLPALDEKIKLYGKRLMFIIARSEYGKTSFMAHMIRTQLMQHKNVLVFSCEEAGEDFINRININSTLDDIMTTNFIMCDKGNISLEDIKLTCLKLDIMGISPDIVYVDQLNKIKPDSDFKGSKHEKIVYVSEQLQNIVKIINRPLVILHQANRASEQKDGLMTQANVSDADAVFNEAQIALFIESPDYFEWCKNKYPYRDTFKYIINVGKNRSKGGWKGAEVCYFDRSKSIFMTEQEFDIKQARNSFGDN
jgi:replicative DNA helicase